MAAIAKALVLMLIISPMLHLVAMAQEAAANPPPHDGLPGSIIRKAFCDAKCSAKCLRRFRINEWCLGKCLIKCLWSYSAADPVYGCTGSCAAPAIAKFHPAEIESAEPTEEIKSAVSYCYRGCSAISQDQSAKDVEQLE